MSVYIKGFPLPNNCGACPLRLAWCIERIYMVTRPERCPLIEIQPHGRLIDADAFHNRLVDAVCKDCDRRKGMKNGKKRILYAIGDAPCRACSIDCAFDFVDAMPTIIEAEVER